MAVERLVPAARLDGQVHLAAPDPAWAERYADLAGRIRAALGERALVLEHVGSTSVPGLSAKPVVDVLLVVADPTDEAAYVGDLVAAGFALHLREDWEDHRLLRPGDQEANVHVFGPDSAEVGRMLRFRDHLRTDEDDLRLYERTKHELAARTWTVMQDYADAKSAVVTDILGRS